jgi:hypothetical protein
MKYIANCHANKTVELFHKSYTCQAYYNSYYCPFRKGYKLDSNQYYLFIQ